MSTRIEIMDERIQELMQRMEENPNAYEEEFSVEEKNLIDSYTYSNPVMMGIIQTLEDNVYKKISSLAKAMKQLNEKFETIQQNMMVINGKILTMGKSMKTQEGVIRAVRKQNKELLKIATDIKTQVEPEAES